MQRHRSVRWQRSGCWIGSMALGLLILAGGSLSADTPVLRVLAAGDSITSGYQVGQPYPNRLQGQLGAGFNVLNMGVPGWTSGHGRAAMPGQLAQGPFGYVLILYGTNDVLAGWGSDGVAENIVTMAREVRRAGAVPIVATLPPFLGPKGYAGERGWAYSREIERLQYSGGYFVAPVAGAFAGRWDAMQGDGFHPNDTGMALIAAAFRAVIQQGEVLGARFAANNTALKTVLYRLGGEVFWSPDYHAVQLAVVPGWALTDALGWLYIGGGGEAVVSDRLGTLFPFRNGNSLYFWAEALGGWLQLSEGQLRSLDYGSLVVSPDDPAGWVLNPDFGWLYLLHGGSPPWVFSERIGWIAGTGDGSNRFFWSDRLHGWLLREAGESGRFAQADWGSLRIPSAGWIDTTALGRVFVADEFAGWGWSERFGFVLPAPGSAGFWFYSAERETWIGRLPDGSFWSVADGRVLE